MAETAGGMGLGQSIGLGLGLGAGYGILAGLMRQSSRWVGWQVIPKSMKLELLGNTMESLINAEKDPVSGLSTKGQIDTMLEFINKTIDFSVWVGEGLASQLFIQMIQQSIAYAIHASHAGSIGTIANVYSGGMYLSGTESISIGENIDLVDRGERAFLSAEVGQNIPTLAFNLTRGANRRIEDVTRSLMRNIDRFLDEWNDLSLSYYRHYHSMARTRLGDAITMKEAVVTRAYGLLEQVANEHLARISEQLDTIEGAKAWFDGDYLSSDELKDFSIKIDLERQASEDNWNDYKDEILGAIEAGIAEWDDKINQALEDMKDVELRYAILIQNVFSEVFADVYDFVMSVNDMCDKALEDVCAYRNMQRAVEVKTVTELGVAEMSPEVEIYRLPIRRWSDCIPITVAYHYQRPRELAWQDADPVKVKEEAEFMQLVSIEEIDFDRVVHPYDTLREIVWKDAGGC